MLEKIAKELPLPALLLDVDAFDKNCKEIAEKAQRKTIRVASKSIRSVPVLKRIFQSSPVFQGIMSYSPYEAIFLADQGFSDILIGYPFWDEQAYIEIAKRNKDERIITIMIDSLEHVQHVKNILANVDGKFYICIDVDMSTTFGTLHFGVRRSPLKTPEQVLNLATTIRETEGLELVGVMGYEAQIAGVGDAAKKPAHKIFKTKVDERNFRSEKNHRPRLEKGGGCQSFRKWWRNRESSQYFRRRNCNRTHRRFGILCSPLV